MTNGFANVGVPQTKVGSVNTGDDFTDELAAYGNSQVDGGNGIPQAVYAVRNLALSAN